MLHCQKLKNFITNPCSIFRQVFYHLIIKERLQVFFCFAFYLVFVEIRVARIQLFFIEL
ncbi:hypothetical protein Syun_017914 [Stephania yunnanensis]|uniref:Uncharacterized protein n=1 Tax=Stephania yunnanensis TaxID=152371 RepID=A0AAP0IRC4_9MAGN